MKEDIDVANITIRPSEIISGSIGVFALRDLVPGVVVGLTDFLDAGTCLVPWAKLAQYDEITKEQIMHFCIGTPEGFIMPPSLDHISIPWHYNHSCEPNVGFDIHGNFIVIKPIKKGEEMCYDYGFVETNPDFTMQCLCGSSSCRGVITGNDWKNPELVSKNTNFMWPDLRL